MQQMGASSVPDHVAASQRAPDHLATQQVFDPDQFRPGINQIQGIGLASPVFINIRSPGWGHKVILN
jgi:hypothetical protein